MYKCPQVNACFSIQFSIYELEEMTCFIKRILFITIYYCLLSWMCHSQTLKNKINPALGYNVLNDLVKECLRIIHNDRKSTIQNLLEEKQFVSILDQNLHVIVTENAFQEAST